MTHVFAFEGVDGSGKTTAISAVRDQLVAAGLRVEVVDKSSSAETAPITELIQSRVLAYHSEAEALLKIARERHRFATVPASADVALFDRGLLSITSVLRADSIDFDWLRPALDRCIKSVASYSTVLCDCPFDVAWRRMHDRFEQGVSSLSKKEARGIEFNRKVCAALLDQIENDPLRGSHLLRVDTYRSPVADSATRISRAIQDVLEAQPGADEQRAKLLPKTVTEDRRFVRAAVEGPGSR